jgi:Urease accessory protein UreF
VNDDAALSSFRLADSFLPDGTHTASYGLEQFVETDRVEDADDLQALLNTYMHQQVGPADLVALRAAHASAAAGDLSGVTEADRRLAANILAAEFRESTLAAGRRLLDIQTQVGDSDLLDRYARCVDGGEAPGTQPAVLGLTTAVAGITEHEACLLCCHAFVTGLLGAAQRLLALGHTDAQQLLVDSRPAMQEAVDDSAGRSLENMVPFTPFIDIVSTEHERAERRLFVS